MSSFERTELVLGSEAVKKLKTKCVAVFGLGGVGSYFVEAVVRAGIGRLIIIDNDKVADSNINRQLYALNSTVGMYKTDVCRERVLDINSDLMVNSYPLFYDETTKDKVDLFAADYIADCIDSVKSKVLIAKMGKELKKPVISALGTGNRINADFVIKDVFETNNCPLAKAFRHELRKAEITSLKTVCSLAEVVTLCNSEKEKDNNAKKSSIGSVSFVPSVAGLIMAGEVIRDLIK